MQRLTIFSRQSFSCLTPFEGNTFVSERSKPAILLTGSEGHKAAAHKAAGSHLTVANPKIFFWTSCWVVVVYVRAFG
jgi:hypothetical protein